MRYLGMVWGPGYPREQVGAVLPPIVSEGLVLPVTRAIAWGDPANCKGVVRGPGRRMRDWRIILEQSRRR
jgi:hypothetical protein